ncbi:ATPase, partial [Desulfobacterales bacterium HSG2]|nr:ATPase [Desulfobacterales bacterium HSG2]
KPVRNVLLQRKEKITGLEQDIDDFKKGAKEKIDAFSSGIKDARAKGLKEKEAIMETAANEEKEIIGKINEKAAANLAEVREQIAKEAEDVRASLMKEVDVFAKNIGQKILGRAV